MPARSVERIRRLLAEDGLDGVLFIHPPNIRYLCGFSGSEGALLVDRGESAFLTDSRYTTQARQQVSTDCVEEYRSLVEGVAARLRARGCKRIGFEADHLIFSRWERLVSEGAGKIEWVPLSKEIRSLRMIKSEKEIDFLRAAARLNAQAFAEIEEMVRPGISERELALELEFALKRRGGEEKAFDFIVASGVRGAMPHGVASEKPLAPGEMITLDFGVRLDGYHSDETVTFALGRPPQILREVFDVVLEAHDLAMKGLEPGRPLREVDEIARSHIRNKGFGDCFGHGLGHGVGLEIHEAPVLSPRSEDVAREGMVVTIEPGIYIPGLGGVRIEDMVAVTADGCEPLTAIPKSFRSFGG